MTTILLVQYWDHVRKQVLSTLDNEEMLSWVLVPERSTITQERLQKIVSSAIVLFEYLARDSVLDEYYTYYRRDENSRQVIFEESFLREKSKLLKKQAC